MWRLRLPTTALLSIAGCHALVLACVLPQFVYSLTRPYRAPELPEMALAILLSIPTIFIAFAAFRMRQMRSLSLCRIGAILACIPYISPGVFFGIPFGVWATIVLFMPSTAAAFDSPPPVRSELREP